MVRILTAAAALALLPVAATAQNVLPSAALQSGLPSASLQMRTPTTILPRDIFTAPPGTYAPTFEEPPQVRPPFFPCCGTFVGAPFFPGFVSGVVEVPGYFPGFANAVGTVKPSWARASASHRRSSAELPGYLRLLVEPGTAQVYVDGFYVGTVAELGRLITLEPGAHRVELRAPSYEPVVIEVQILRAETITYRVTLQPTESAVKPTAATPGTPKTFYVIPSCYAGDRPPQASALPRGCDVAQLRTIPPRMP